VGPADLSSHALIGGYAGAAVMRSGWHVIIAEGWYKTLIFIVVAPIIGLILGFTFMVAIYWLLRNKAPRKIDAWFRKLQLFSAAAYSLGHGGNDAQKTMGIVASALYGAHYLSAQELAGSWGNFTGPSFWQPMPRSRSAPTSAVGASFTPWARASPSSSP